MHIVAVDGVGAEPFRERLLEEMTDRGRTVTVRATGHQVATADSTVVEIDRDGSWQASGPNATVDEWVDTLAPQHRFAIVLTADTTRWPHIVVGETEVRSDLLASPTPRADVDVPALVDALEETEPFVTLESLVEDVKGSADADRAGAIATFTGRVRAKDDPDDTATQHLEFETYAGVAEAKLAALATELEDREDVWAVRLHHRTGVIPAGADIVFVVVLAGHREAAFRTVEDGINRLKAEVPIFKKEVTVGDEFWVHTRP